MRKIKKIYHATKPINLPSILENGIIPPPWSNVSYFSSKKEGAFQFMSTRMMEEIRDETGNKILGFKFFDKCYVLEISTENLDWSFMDLGNDHDPIFFKNAGRVYVYGGVIPPSDILEVWSYDVKDGNVKKHGKNPPIYKEDIRMFPDI